MRRALSLALRLAPFGILALLPSPAAASFGFAAFDGALSDAGGASYTRAGGHPYSASTVLELNATPDRSGALLPDGEIKNLRINLPPGLLGNPTVLPTCDADRLLAFACPLASQVGVVTMKLNSGEPYLLTAPLYQIDPPRGVTAQFGFQINSTAQVLLNAGLRSDGDYGLDLDLRSASQVQPLLAAKVLLWGVPADPSHDQQRCAFFIVGDTCVGPPGTIVGPNPAGVPASAFLSLPTACPPPGSGLRTLLHAESWQLPTRSAAASYVSHAAPGFTDLSLLDPPLPPQLWGPEEGPDECGAVPFGPRLSVRLTNAEADSPTGLELELAVPGDGLENPLGVSQSHLKQASLSLPEGLSINPALASGLEACSMAQLTRERAESVPTEGCPPAAKIGSASILTPLLAEPLDGDVFLAAPHENRFGSLLAFYIVLRSPERGLLVRLEARVDADPETGQLRATIEDGPQLPFTRFRLKLKSGPRAPLIAPAACGAYTVAATLAPWARPEQPVVLHSGFEVTRGPEGPCPQPSQFEPTFAAGTVAPLAGAYSPLVVRADRKDGSQALRGLTVGLPAGLTAKLAAIPYCTDLALQSAEHRSAGAEWAAASCPLASQLGAAQVAVGAGPTPFAVSGRAYLAGPYDSAPFSVAVVVPALAGPFDLGTVVVRAGAEVDPRTARVRLVSDPLPTILQGIPIKLRSIQLIADRPRFTLNPTSCEPMSLSGLLVGLTQGRLLSSRFQVGGCRGLPFRPRLTLVAEGSLGRRGHPIISARLSQLAGEANLDRARIVLPRTQMIDNAHIELPCTRAQFAERRCPQSSRLGRAKLSTPLLDRPLEGPVYFRSNGGARPLPDLVADLRGQIPLTVVGQIGSVDGRLKATFNAVPDAPVSTFTLRLLGGRRGLLQNSADLCAGPGRANVRLLGQNGGVHEITPLLRVRCDPRPR